MRIQTFNYPDRNPQILPLKSVQKNKGLFDEGLFDLVCYIEDDKARYFHFILSGQLPEGEENPAESEEIL